MDTFSITLALYSVLLAYLNLVMIRCFSEGGGGGWETYYKRVPITYVCNYFSFITCLMVIYMYAFPKTISCLGTYSNPLKVFLSVTSVSFILGRAGNLSARNAI